MIKPYLKDQDLLDSIQGTDKGPGRFYLWWLGQSGFLIQWLGRHLLLDPYLSESLTRKYADTDKPHIRMTERVIDPIKLDFINVVTSSHNHTDHLDAETLIPLMKVNNDMKLIIPKANLSFVCDRLGCSSSYPIVITDGASETIGPFTIHGVPAAHNEISRDANGNCHFMGYVVKFGPWTIYHSGDTLWYQGLEEILTPYNIDLALLPINGNKPERRVSGNLDHQEAALLASKCGASLVIPCHYEMFTFNTADPALFKKAAEELDQPAYILKCGEPWNSHMMTTP